MLWVEGTAEGNNSVYLQSLLKSSYGSALCREAGLESPRWAQPGKSDSVQGVGDCFDQQYWEVRQWVFESLSSSHLDHGQTDPTMRRVLSSVECLEKSTEFPFLPGLFYSHSHHCSSAWQHICQSWNFTEESSTFLKILWNANQREHLVVTLWK